MHSKIVTYSIDNTEGYALPRKIRQVISNATKIYPNIDLYPASLYNAMGLPRELFAPIFAIRRTVGWTSHIVEQLSKKG